MSEQVNNQEFAIQRVYVKDASYEAPHMPAILTDNWQPSVNVNLQTKVTKLDDKTYDIVLTVTVNTQVGERAAFLVEVYQAGVFTIHGFNDADLDHMLNSFCPNMLFPYAREFISEMIVRGGFPPLYLAPVNFDALYQQHRERKVTDDQKA